MSKKTLTFSQVVNILRTHYGPPVPPPTSDPFELILFENVAYLASPARRREAFELLRNTIGTSPTDILNAKQQDLEKIASRGILKATFVAKLRECGRIALKECDGEVTAAVRQAPDTATQLLRRFPGIGMPGAEKILLFSGQQSLLAPESNGLRVLVRLGLIPERKSYSQTYDGSHALRASTTKAAQEAHLLLKSHGEELCKRTKPKCLVCPLMKQCSFASRRP